MHWNRIAPQHTFGARRSPPPPRPRPTAAQILAAPCCRQARCPHLAAPAGRPAPRPPPLTSQLTPSFSSISAARSAYPTILLNATSVTSLPSRMTCARRGVGRARAGGAGGVGRAAAAARPTAPTPILFFPSLLCTSANASSPGSSPPRSIQPAGASRGAAAGAGPGRGCPHLGLADGDQKVLVQRLVVNGEGLAIQQLVLQHLLAPRGGRAGRAGRRQGPPSLLRSASRQSQPPLKLTACPSNAGEGARG